MNRKPHGKRIRASGVFCLLLTSYLLYSFSVEASEVSNSQEISTWIQNTSAHATIPGTARDWGLSEAEWVNYHQLMQGQDAQWYRQLSPAAVLGLHAQTEEEERHFAELVARQEHDKVARELAFNHAVYSALRRLYADEPVIQPFDKTPFNPNSNRRRP